MDIKTTLALQFDVLAYPIFTKFQTSPKFQPDHSRVIDQVWPKDEHIKLWSKGGHLDVVQGLDLAGFEYSEEGFGRWNIILNNGQKSDFGYKGEMKKFMLPEDDKIVKVELYYHHSYFYLSGLKFFNDREDLLLKVGHFKFDQKVEVSLKYNERILGCRFRYH